MIIIKQSLLYGAVLVLFQCCAKSSFLNQKPNNTFFVPETLDDFRSMLDDDKLINQHTSLNILSADLFYYTDPFIGKLRQSELNAYKWEKQLFGEHENVADWDIPFQQVNYANQVLDGLTRISINASNKQSYNRIKGSALFIRAYAFFNLSQLFAMPYDSATAGSEPGIPLRTSTDVSAPSVRSTVEKTYRQILDDLQAAADLLPPIDPTNKNRPSAPAAQAMLARVYLSMRAYSEALTRADQCLRLYDSLMDYNHISITASIPFARNNAEVLYQGRMNPANTSHLAGFTKGGCFIDDGLMRSYLPGDLRRQAFFKDTLRHSVTKGSYYGDISFFTGLATDEVLLIRAECYAIAGNTAAAMKDLNRLLEKRYDNKRFTPLTAHTSQEARKLVLEERYKELVLRGQRWTDIRRFNREGSEITLKRVINGQTISLPPNDRRYALPIPDKVIRLSGMQQNER